MWKMLLIIVVAFQNIKLFLYIKNIVLSLISENWNYIFHLNCFTIHLSFKCCLMFSTMFRALVVVVVVVVVIITDVSFWTRRIFDNVFDCFQSTLQLKIHISSEDDQTSNKKTSSKQVSWASAGDGKRGHLPPPLGRPK